MKIKALLAPGFEESEAITVVDILRRANYDVTLVSINENKEVEGNHNIKIITDTIFDEEYFLDTDAIFLPGGGTGTENLANNRKVIELVKDFNLKKKYITAICAAPYVLEKAGILKGRKVTVYPNWMVKVSSPTIITSNVVVDDNIVTGKGMGVSIEFGLKLVELFSGKEEAEKIKKSIVYK